MNIKATKQILKGKLIGTVQGVQKATVPEFDPAEYKGLRSGIGKTRRSSKHFNCDKKPCGRCMDTVVDALRKKRSK